MEHRKPIARSRSYGQLGNRRRRKEQLPGGRRETDPPIGRFKLARRHAWI